MIERYLHGLEVPKDELTPIERNKLINEGKEVDRIQCSLDGGDSLAYLINCKMNEYYHSSEKMFELEKYMYETFATDGVGISTTLRGMAEAMGSEIRYFDDNVAQLKKPALTLREIDNAKLVDVDKDGRLPIILEAVRLVKKNLGDKVPVSGTLTGPFTVAAMVLGTEHLMVGMIKKPEKIKQLMEVITENNNRYIRRLLDIGVGIGFADPVSSTSLISPHQYEEFSLPYFKQNVDFIKRNGGGCGLHICGTSRAIWESFKDSGIGTFGLDNVESLTEAKEVLGDTMCIQGNVPPVEVMRLGTPHDVLRSARDCIKQGHDSPKGFVLTSGCQMSMFTPKENMQALMDAARIFGRYPLNKDLWEQD